MHTLRRFWPWSAPSTRTPKLIAVTVIAVVAALLAVPSAAQAFEGDPANSPPPEDAGDTDPMSEGTPRDTDHTVVVPEDLPFPDDFDRNTARWPSCWHLIGCGSGERADADTAYMNCQTSWIDAIALSYNTAGTNYDVIHIDYNWRALIGVGGPVASVSVANTMYNRMHDCLDDHSFDPDVRDWDAIWQQLHCHVFYQIGGGATWDLEGHRQSNWVGYLSLHNRCSQ